MEEHPAVSKKAKYVLPQFSTSYLRELRFSYFNNFFFTDKASKR